MAKLIDPDDLEIDPIISVMGRTIPKPKSVIGGMTLTQEQTKFLQKMLDENWYPFDSRPVLIQSIINTKYYTIAEQKLLQEMRIDHIRHLKSIK